MQSMVPWNGTYMDKFVHLHVRTKLLIIIKIASLPSISFLEIGRHAKASNI